MKNGLCILSIVWLVLTGCENRADLISSFNDRPYFMFAGDTITSLVDSVKTSRGRYNINVNFIDPNENLASLILRSSVPSGSFYLSSSIVVGETVPIENQSVSLSYDAVANGAHDLEITMVDDFGESATLDVDLRAFDNLVPVASFVANQPQGAGPFERLVDASASVDGDQNFGGAITEYEYSFLGIVRNTSDNTQTVIFPSSGVYNIIVRVKDNDGVWSEPVSQNIEI